MDKQRRVLLTACFFGVALSVDPAWAQSVTVIGPDNKPRTIELAPNRPSAPAPTGTGESPSAEPAPIAVPVAPPVLGEPGALLLSANGAEREADCSNKDVTIEGDRGAFSLHGGCRSLAVRGDSLTVEAEMQPGGRIEVAGNRDAVSYFLRHPGPEPITSINGNNSRISRVQALGKAALGTGLAPAGAPEPIVLSGDGGHQSADCAGRDVRIEGNSGTYVLQGGCRSLSIEGNGNAIQAEVLPGTRIAIAGNDNTVAFVPSGRGPDPIVSVSGSGSHAWRVERLGASPTSGVEVTSKGIAVPGGAGAVVTEMPSVPQLMQDLGARQTDQGTLVSLSNDVLFDFNSDAIRPDAKDRLIKPSQLIMQTHPPALKIIGNTDSVGTDQYNMDLSRRRARSVERWLAGEGHVALANVQVEGHGFHEPVAPNTKPDGSDNPEGRQKNRRVDVLIEK